MSPKNGILHDYDLHANHESSAQDQTCVVCSESPMTFQWSDYSGEAMCTRCGTPYQIKWGSDEQKEEGAYPYLNLSDEWVDVVREHWIDTQRFTCLGAMFFTPTPGRRELYEWVRQHHPDMVDDK